MGLVLVYDIDCHLTRSHSLLEVSSKFFFYVILASTPVESKDKFLQLMTHCSKLLHHPISTSDLLY